MGYENQENWKEIQSFLPKEYQLTEKTMPKEEQYVFEDFHEPIITKELYYKAQEEHKAREKAKSHYRGTKKYANDYRNNPVPYVQFSQDISKITTKLVFLSCMGTSARVGIWEITKTQP